MACGFFRECSFLQHIHPWTAVALDIRRANFACFFSPLLSPLLCSFVCWLFHPIWLFPRPPSPLLVHFLPIVSLTAALPDSDSHIYTLLPPMGPVAHPTPLPRDVSEVPQAQHIPTQPHPFQPGLLPSVPISPYRLFVQDRTWESLRISFSMTLFFISFFSL